MARIRSIKPEFFTDGKIARLPADTALFFIGLWCLSDDFGFFSTDSRELSLSLPRWRSQNVLRMLTALQRCALIRVSRVCGVGVVVGWNHQRIKDRRASKWNEKEIIWDEPENNAPEPRKNGPGEEGRGEEGKGRESLTGQRRRKTGPSGGQQKQQNLLAASGKPMTAPEAKKVAKSGAVWEAYRQAYLNRYGVEPKRHSKTNVDLCRVVDKLGWEESPEVAAYYLKHNDQFYVRNLHPTSLLDRDADKLRTEWVTGRRMLGTQARDIERAQNNYDVFERAFAKIEAEKSARKPGPSHE
jgi:hypothetical protein